MLSSSFRYKEGGGGGALRELKTPRGFRSQKCRLCWSSCDFMEKQRRNGSWFAEKHNVKALCPQCSRCVGRQLFGLMECKIEKFGATPSFRRPSANPQTSLRIFHAERLSDGFVFRTTFAMGQERGGRNRPVSPGPTPPTDGF